MATKPPLLGYLEDSDFVAGPNRWISTEQVWTASHRAGLDRQLVAGRGNRAVGKTYHASSHLPGYRPRVIRAPDRLGEAGRGALKASS